MIVFMGLVLGIFVGIKILGPIWMVGAIILAACYLFMGKFFKASMFLCLFIFLENNLWEEVPRELTSTYLVYGGLGIALEVIKWYVLTTRRKRLEIEPTENNQPIQLKQNRKGVWVVR